MQQAPHASAAPTSSRKESAEVEPSPAAGAASQAAPKGALFQALVEAGVDAKAAYTATGETQSMASEIAAAQVQATLVEIRQMFVERDHKVDAMLAERDRMLDARFAERDRMLDARFAAIDRRFDVLTAEMRAGFELVNARIDAVHREVRLIWGALGVLITLLTVVFGFLFSA